MSSCTRIVTRVWTARHLKWGTVPKPRVRGVTLYAGVAEDGTRYLHTGDKRPVELARVAPKTSRYVKPEDRDVARDRREVKLRFAPSLLPVVVAGVKTDDPGRLNLRPTDERVVAARAGEWR